jgi:replicative DNA helicase
MELETTIRELVDKRKIKIVFIDYLNLVSTDKSTKPRTEQIVDISKSLKTLSMELSIPIIGLIQLGRDAESQIPNITDVGEMEKYADIILLLNKEDAISNEVAKQNYKVIIAKNREKGKLDKIDIHFIPDKVRFEN